jgi:chromosome segregation ATPase
MTDIDNIVLEHLLHIRAALDDIRDDAREIQRPLGSLERHYASLSTRMDRMDERIGRIERCLDLTEA